MCVESWNENLKKLKIMYKFFCMAVNYFFGLNNMKIESNKDCMLLKGIIYYSKLDIPIYSKRIFNVFYRMNTKMLRKN